VGYIEGFEHNMFFRLFAESLPAGFRHITHGNSRREAWLEENSHLVSSTMLLSTFSYLEGILDENWIEEFGNDFQPELDCLRIIRNAITHNDGIISANRKNRGLTGPEQLEFVETFIESLESNNYEPLQNWDDAKRIDYIFLDENVVKLGESSIGRIGALGHNILRRAGKIVFDQ
jgi:hypothetical protein